MKKLLLQIGAAILLLSIVSAVTVYRIRDIQGDKSGDLTLKQELANRYTKAAADTIFNLVINNINPHDSVWYKDETYHKDTIDSKLSKKANLYQPALVNPTVTTQAVGDNSTKAASTAFIANAVRQVLPKQSKTYSFPYNNTGNTNENVIITDTIPANSIGVNGSFHVMFRFSATLNTNAKYIRIKFNGTTIAGILSNSASNNYGSLINILTNKGSHTAHTGGSVTSATGQTFGVGTVGFVSYTTEYDSSQQIIVSVTEQVAVGTDYIRLESLQIESHP